MFGIRFTAGKETPESMTFSTMRRAIGVLGMALPVILFTWSVLLTGGHFLLDSISSYYHTNLRDVFSGTLCAVSFFLFAYHGYDRLDCIAFKIAAAGALGVAFFPAFIKTAVNPWVHVMPNVSPLTNAVHYFCAGTFFVTLALVSLFLFTRSATGRRFRGVSARKRLRNIIYIVCGVVILLCCLAMLILGLIPDSATIFTIEPVFWVETLALFAFASSWLVKGGVILKDRVKG